MEEEMKKMVKRTAAVTLAGIMSVGMLTGCGSKTIDGTKTVATVDGTEIPLGVVSLYARQQQEQIGFQLRQDVSAAPLQIEHRVDD